MTSSKHLINQTLARRMISCIETYEQIKSKQCPYFKTVREFCKANKFSHQNFMKIYHRYLSDPRPESLVPQKRGPKFAIRRTDIKVEARIIELRQQGHNRYTICQILKNEGILLAPSPTTVYNLCKKHGLNRLRKPQKQERRKIIMSKIGELAHIDCHQLSQGITIANPDKTYYLLGLIDDYSRLAWVEVLEDKKALNVMFATMRAFNMLKSAYGVEIDSIMSDNGAEFGSGKNAKNKDEHPFERLLMEMQMKHLYTKPYHPQTNGKIERFWKTMKEDFIEDSLFEDLDDLKNELLGFIVYYNEHRPHSALNGKTPKEFANSCN